MSQYYSIKQKHSLIRFLTYEIKQKVSFNKNKFTKIKIKTRK